MKLKSLALAVAAVSALAGAVPAFAQAKEQFFPLLVYRTGPYAPNGTPYSHQRTVVKGGRSWSHSIA